MNPKYKYLRSNQRADIVIFLGTNTSWLMKLTGLCSLEKEYLIVAVKMGYKVSKFVPQCCFLSHGLEYD